MLAAPNTPDHVSAMQFEIAYCPACGMRRVAHSHLCTVCGSLVRSTRESTLGRRSVTLRNLRPIVRAQERAAA